VRERQRAAGALVSGGLRPKIKQNENEEHMTTNGNVSTPETAATMAKAMLAGLYASTPAAAVAQPKQAQPGYSLASLAGPLEAAVAADPELERAIEEVMARAIRHALVASSPSASVASTEDFVAMLRSKTIGARSKGGTVARAFWWGFHIEVSHEDLQAFLGGANAVNTIVGAIGGGIPSPAAPFIALAAAFVAATLGVLASLDRGKGVYISMLWIAPGIFVPTTVV